MSKQALQFIPAECVAAVAGDDRRKPAGKLIVFPTGRMVPTAAVHTHRVVGSTHTVQSWKHTQSVVEEYIRRMEERARVGGPALKRAWEALGLSPEATDSVFRGALQSFVYQNPDAPIHENLERAMAWCQTNGFKIAPEILAAKERLAGEGESSHIVTEASQ